MGKYKVEDGTITKWVFVETDIKRPGLLICRHYDENDKHIDTTWGKKNQTEIKEYMKGGAA